MAWSNACHMTIHLPIGSIVAAGSPPSGNWKSASVPSKFARKDGDDVVVGYAGSSPPAGWSPFSGGFGWVAQSGISNLRAGDHAGKVDADGSPATEYVELHDEDS